MYFVDFFKGILLYNMLSCRIVDSQIDGYAFDCVTKGVNSIDKLLSQVIFDSFVMPLLFLLCLFGKVQNINVVWAIIGNFRRLKHLVFVIILH